MPAGTPLTLPEGKSWEKLKDEFIAENLNQDKVRPFTYKDLADRYGLPHTSVKQQAYRYKWKEELAAEAAKVPNVAREKMIATAVFDEIEVRTRQMTYARLAQSKAMLALQAIDPSKLCVRDAIALLKLGLEQERMALGLDGAPVNLNVTVNEHHTNDQDDFSRFLRVFAGEAIDITPKELPDGSAVSG